MWWALLVACNGGEADVADDDKVVDTDTDLPEPTGEPGDTDPPLPEYFEVSNIFVESRFGFNLATQSIDVVERIHGTFEFPMIEVILANEQFNGDLQDGANYCSILIVLESSTIADWVLSEPRLIWGVDWDPMDAPLTNCNTTGFELNPFDWGLDPILTFTNDPNWGVAVGLPTKAITAEFEPILGDDIQYLLGGTLRIPEVLPGDPLDNVYAYAYAVDEEMVLVDADEDQLLDSIPADQVHDGNRLTTSAYFTVFTTTAWSAR